jgi:hypothetical protein
MHLRRHIPPSCPDSQAAEVCFGSPEWPAGGPVPRLSIEFDVGDATAVGPAAQELEQVDTNCCIQRGRNHGGQTVARLQSPEGAIVGISYIPVFHDEN